MPIELYNAEVNEADRATVLGKITAAVIAKSGDDKPVIELFGSTKYGERFTVHFIATVHHCILRGRVNWAFNKYVTDIELDEVASREEAIATSTTRVTVVRCPMCGSTNAGEFEGAYEFGRLRCETCKYESDFIDNEEIKDEWNDTIEIAHDANALPPFVKVRDR